MYDSKLEQVRILIVENEEAIRTMLSNVLQKLGFSKIYGAVDGFEGLEILRTKPIDMILTDWELRPRAEHRNTRLEKAIIKSEWGEFPPYNGAAFVRSLRHNSFSPNPFIPVIMMTGPTMSSTVRYARDAGVTEILMKPIVTEELCRRIIEIIERPRNFITSADYKGPCRRRKQVPYQGEDRRKLEVRVLSQLEQRQAVANDE